MFSGIPVDWTNYFAESNCGKLLLNSGIDNHFNWIPKDGYLGVDPVVLLDTCITVYNTYI